MNVTRTSFPDMWHITHTENHWSNKQSMIEYVAHILIPYLDSVRGTEEKKQKAIIIFDVFAAHRCSEFIEKLTLNDMIPIFIPGGCTGELQPLDISVQGSKCLRKVRFPAFRIRELDKKS